MSGAWQARTASSDTLLGASDELELSASDAADVSAALDALVGDLLAGSALRDDASAVSAELYMYRNKVRWRPEHCATASGGRSARAGAASQSPESSAARDRS